MTKSNNKIKSAALSFKSMPTITGIVDCSKFGHGEGALTAS